MAEQRCGDHGGLTDAAAATRRDEQHHHQTMTSAEEAGAEDLCLEEILRLYNQPINEEQAWAVCYQCCRTLAKGHRSRRSSSAAAGASSSVLPGRISGPGDVRIQRDGSVTVENQGCEGKYSPCTTTEVIGESLRSRSLQGSMDWAEGGGMRRGAQPPLEQLIDLMTNMAEATRASARQKVM
ncbi:protein spire homolog 1-like isoform X1 [Lates japonicus]|uniref:Protein spire homolog 1-like isoform X1 n=1 Tax=Lates japonicus TaxID=270547 RepID=A0AAD3M714_LATJO|nr:protein spire homolog 1-like isoform X1 [Lates japonicus]